MEIPRFLRPNWEKVAEEFEHEDRDGALKDARTAIWLRLEAATGETDAGPTREACQEKIDAAMEAGARFPAADLDAAWHSKRFGDGPGSVGQQTYSSADAKSQRDAYQAFIQKYGDEEAVEQLPAVMKWKEVVERIAGPYDGQFELTGEICKDPEEVLEKISTRADAKAALRQLWKIDIVARSLRGRLTTQQAEWLFAELENAYTQMQRKDPAKKVLRPPSVQGYASEADFIAAYAKQSNE